MIEIIIIIIGVLCLFFITWWAHIRKHLLLEKRLMSADETLLEEVGLKVDSVLQAPIGSLTHPYIIINEDTTNNK
ncbi:MAG: hypothetical protein CMB56_006125 [Methanobacteriota archaeon]|nr:MAG: hypothetical protein CMB56_006125 [Euryarchaeota archaeon]